MKAILFYLFFYDLFYNGNCYKNEIDQEQEYTNNSLTDDYEFGFPDINNSNINADIMKRSAEDTGHILTCVTCNNVDTRACGRPLHNFIKTEKCSRTTDRCLSIHTPFGIVTRGCYDISRKQMLYFCACDLCNHLPVRDVIRYIRAGDKKKWIQDVADMSHARRLRHSTKKGLKCLSCSVSWSETGDQKEKILYTACVEGTSSFSVGMSTEVCQETDVCGIRIVKLSGTVVRGCVGGPLYNYFYQFCDEDNCNTDPIVSVYDPV